MNEGGMRFYSNSEIDLLIDDISEAALEAIEQAAGEAAKAAVLSMVEREAAALREAAYRQAEAQRWRIETELLSQEITQAKRAERRNAIIGVLAGILGGLAIGIGGTIAISR